MTFYNNADGTPEPPICTQLTATTLTTIYTATDNSYTLDTATFVNNNTGSVDCTLYWRQNGTAVDALVWVGTVRSKGVDGPGNLNANFPIRLMAGDIIKAQTTSAGVWINLLLMRNSRMRDN